MDDNNASLVTAEMQAKVDEAAKAKIKSGEIKVHDYMSDNTCPAATF
jgi:basic membrane protein A